jgi:methyl-accepting chemotaxis protein
MQTINQMKLATRLSLGFGLVLALLVATAGFGISRMAQIEARLETIVHENNEQLHQAVQMRIAVNQVATGMRDVVLLSDAEEMKAARERIQVARANYDKAADKLGKMFAEMASTTGNERDALAKIKEQQAAARQVNSEVIELGLANKNDEAIKVLMTRAQPSNKAWLQSLGELAELEKKLSEEAADEAAKEYATARVLMLVICGVALLSGVAAAVLLTRSVLRQLGGEPQYATEVVQRIADGDLGTPVHLRSGDETSLLAAMSRMQQKLAAVVGDIRSGS